MFYLLLLPFSLVAWFLGVFHARGKGSAKYGFLVLLILPVPLERQGLVIFITAFFILGFLYAQEGSFSALFLRLRAVLSKNTAASTQKAGKKRRTRPFKYKQKRPNPSSCPGREQEPGQEQAGFTESRTTDDYREEVRKKREEEINRERSGEY